jgi:hypothetical protein
MKVSPRVPCRILVSCGQNRRPDRARGIRHSTRRNWFPFTRSVHGRACSKILLGTSSVFPSLLWLTHNVSETLRGVFRRRAFLSDRIEDYMLRFFSNKLRALMRLRRGGHWNAVLISCGHRAKVSPRESWPSLAVCCNHLLGPAGRDGHAALCTPIRSWRRFGAWIGDSLQISRAWRESI